MRVPVFIFDRDGGLDVEAAEGPTGMEAIDVAAGEYPDAYALSGERLRVEVEGHPEMGDVVLRHTGEHALDELVVRVRDYADRTHLKLDGTGDYLIDVANAFAASAWQHRWPKRPKWISRKLHGDGPLRFIRP